MRNTAEAQTILVVGAGRFGARIVQLLKTASYGPIRVVDIDPAKLTAIDDPAVEVVQADGVAFLAENFKRLQPNDIVVPALPVHLAVAWLHVELGRSYKVVPRRVPDIVAHRLPNTWRIAPELLLASYADFICPEDCQEPERCSVSGEARDVPMRRLLRNLKVDGFSTHAIASLQLAPGAGGYRASDLDQLRQRVVNAGTPRNWLVATACKCHAMLSAFALAPR